MICAVFYNSGFKRTLCGSKWKTLPSGQNAFTYLGSGSAISTARHGCCPANKYMSSPFISFSDASSCSPCPVGTKVTLATSVPNDETSCMVGVYDKMPDGCKGLGYNGGDRSCDARKAVDELNADGSGTHLTYGPMKNWDMSLVTDISHLFYNKKTMNADLSSWNVAGVTNMKNSTYSFNFNSLSPFFFCILFLKFSILLNNIQPY